MDDEKIMDLVGIMMRDGFLHIFTLTFILFIAPVGGSNPMGANFLTSRQSFTLT